MIKYLTYSMLSIFLFMAILPVVFFISTLGDIIFSVDFEQLTEGIDNDN